MWVAELIRSILRELSPSLDWQLWARIPRFLHDRNDTDSQQVYSTLLFILFIVDYRLGRNKKKMRILKAPELRSFILNWSSFFKSREFLQT